MNTLIDKLLSIFKNTKYYPIEVQSPVFDLSQSYGGNQASPCSEKDPDKIKQYHDIIQKNNPSLILNDEQLKHYLNRLYSEGCGYVSICNSILRHHIGQEDLYQSRFGYPLYTTQNKIDFDTLIVDFYSATDNRSFLLDPTDMDFYEDYNEKTDGPKEKYDFRNDDTGFGTYLDRWNEKLPIFFKKRGIKVRSKMISGPTPNKIAKLIAQGYDVIVSLRQGPIYHMDGSVRQNIENGHAMYVTGVTSEQKYLVSTWGEKCYIDPKDCKHSKTAMRFMYLIFDYKQLNNI